MERIKLLLLLIRESIACYRLIKTQLEVGALEVYRERAGGVLAKTGVRRKPRKGGRWFHKFPPFLFSTRKTPDASSAFRLLWPQLPAITLGGALTLRSKKSWRLLVAFALTNGCERTPNGLLCCCSRCRFLVWLLQRLSSTRQ